MAFFVIIMLLLSIPMVIILSWNIEYFMVTVGVSYLSSLIINLVQYLLKHADWKTTREIFQSKSLLALSDRHIFQIYIPQYRLLSLPKLCMIGQIDDYEFKAEYYYNLEQNDMKFSVITERPSLDNLKLDELFDSLKQRGIEVQVFTEYLQFELYFPIDKLRELSEVALLSEFEKLTSILRHFRIRQKYNKR